jgi:HEXXH motif-containing protein
VLEKLFSGQLGRYKLLLCAVMRYGTQAVPAAEPALRKHYELLAAIERQAPSIVTTVLRAPHVGAWAAQCLRRLWKDPGSAAPNLDYLGAIAASAAIRAGYPCSLTLSLRDGTLPLPTLGRVILPGTHATVTVSGPAGTTITSDGRTIAFPADPHADAPGWQGLRLLTMGHQFLFLDDLDPNRNYDPYPLLDRLGPQDVARWQDMLGEAWRLLTEHHPRYAAALHGGLRSLVPIGQRAEDKNVSATSGDAFGAVATSLPSDGATLAVALMHEFQHAKLCAVVDLEPLYDRDAKNLFYAPWRPDPRPVGPLLHGIFAHMAVAEFWRVHRHVASGQHRMTADVEFARWLRQTHHAAVLLDGHPALTATGRELLSHVTVRLTSWLGESVPGQALKLATEISSDHLSNWRLRL